MVAFLTTRDSANNDSLEPNTIAVAEGENVIYVPDQAPGATVYAGFAVLNENGFMVIRNNAGGLGDPIGASALLAAGEHDNVQVAVTPALEDGGMYYAMLYKDDGDSTFNFANDTPLQDTLGNNLYTIFLVRDGNIASPVQIAP